MARGPMSFAWGGYTTVGAAFAIRTQGSPNWTGVRNGAGDATLTWGAAEAIDATESIVHLTGRTAQAAPIVAAQTDTTLQVTVTDGGAAALEAAIDFEVRAFVV